MPDQKISLSPLPVKDWDESLSNVLEDMKQRPLNVHALMAHHPDLLQAWWNFRNYSVVGGDLGKRKGELVILRIAHHLQAWYEWGAHVERGMACGLSLSEIEEVRLPIQQTTFDDADKTLLQVVDELYVDKKIQPDTLSAARAHFSTKQVMDIMAIQGMYVILGCMIKTWGLELEDFVLEKLPEGVTKEAFLSMPVEVNS